MKHYKLIFQWAALLLFAAAVLFWGCSQTPQSKLVVEHLMTGPYTNCFLMYDSISGEAALVDVGGPIDTLLQIIDANDLTLKYFLCTHGHIDHLMGLPAVRDRFPDAKVCLNKLDYEDMLVQLDWIYENLDSTEIAEWKSDAEVAKFFDFDPASFGEPDIYLEEGQVYKLGNLAINTIYAPGHSRGSICFQVGNILFSGDVLMYRSAGRDDFQNSDSEQLKASILKLYKLLPDSTEVYPGHGPPTNIGDEKRENQYVNAEEI